MDTVHNIEVRQNRSIQEEIQWTDDDLNPINLTGYKALMDVKKTAKDTISVLSLSSLSNSELRIVDNSIILHLKPSRLQTITPGRYVYDLVLVNGDDAYPILMGEFTVSPGVTKI